MHTKARIAFSKGQLTESKELLKVEIAASRNVIPNLGVLIRVLCALFDGNYVSFPAIASVELKEAENALNKIIEVDPSNEFLDGLKRAITDRQAKQKPIRRI
jgi:hypothetical protein